MGMQLNIKGEEAYRLASRLAELTGQSLTKAVVEALRHQVEVQEKARDKEALMRDILALAAEIRAELTKDGEPLDLSTDFLYDDETGLPV